MRLFLLSLSLIPSFIHASIHNNNLNRWIHPAFSLPSPRVQSAKDELLSFSQKLNTESKTGVFINDVESKQQLKKLVAELEAICDTPAEPSQTTMLGDWKLLCTIATPSEDSFASQFKFPFFPSPTSMNNNFFNSIQSSIRESIQVVQRIRKVDNDSTEFYDMDDDVFNRVDNVIEFIPSSESPFPNLNNNLINWNPLEISKSKITLAHKGTVESVSPLLRTKLILKNVVLTVAGTSQYLEPNGEDVLGINVLLGDLFNFGCFDTTFVDDDIRVSRGKVGLIDQLRVFVRINEGIATEEAVKEEVEEKVTEEKEVEKEEEEIIVPEIVDNTGEDQNNSVESGNDDDLSSANL